MNAQDELVPGEQDFMDKILAFYPNYDKVGGPYTREDKRMHIIIYGKGQPNKTISWPKAVMEVKLGRKLTKDETVDHIDEDETNNNPDNFQILTKILGKARKPCHFFMQVDLFFQRRNYVELIQTHPPQFPYGLTIWSSL